MKKIATALILGLMIMTGPITLPRGAHANVEWKTLKEIDLKTETLDVASSPDEQVLFLLSRSEVLIYSLREEKVIDRILLDGEFDRIHYLPRTNALMLTNTSKRNLRIIKMEFIQNFDITELPYQGSEKAPATVVVFNDYQ
jgi:hypothetical protein